MSAYFAFRFFSGRSTTTGQPNEKTGRFSIAGDVVAFKSVEDRDQWIEKEKISAPCGLGGGAREAMSRKEIRNLFLGMSISDFNQMIDDIIESLDE